MAGATSVIASSPWISARAADPAPAEITALAEEGFIYGLPIVMNYELM
jgi:hypothetical protein